jgi:DNA-directed RNA polymerase specialized sigma24 family protein
VARNDEESLRRFVAARDAGELEAARRHWEVLLESNFDRVVALVSLQARGRLDPHERDEAVERAIVKVWRNMVSTFDGRSMGEWINAVRACAGFAVVDVQREAARRSKRQRSLDELEEHRWASRAHEEHRRERERADAREFVAWGLPQLKDARRRLVLERSLDGVPAEAIAAELDVSLPNLYQLRSRGLKELAKLKEVYDA